MTRKQFRTKVRELKRNNNKLLEEAMEEIINSDNIDLSFYDDDFVLPKMFMYAFALEMQFQWKPFDRKSLKEAKRMSLFM